MIVCLMCPMMSFIATLLFKNAGSNFIAVWFQTTVMNFPMALCWQIFGAGPLGRLIFRTVMKAMGKQETPAADRAESCWFITDIQQGCIQAWAWAWPHYPYKEKTGILCIQNRGFLILKVDRPKSLYYDYIVDKDEDRDSSSVWKFQRVGGRCEPIRVAWMWRSLLSCRLTGRHILTLRL